MRYQFKSLVRDVFEKFRHHSDRDLLLHLTQRIEHMSKQLDALKADVTANTTVVGSAVTLLTSLKAELDAAILANENGDDGQALADLSASLEASTGALAAAISANTPAHVVDSSASTPIHPSTNLPATPDQGSDSDMHEPDPRAPAVLTTGETDAQTPPVAGVEDPATGRPVQS